jgi:hypothetical protein
MPTTVSISVFDLISPLLVAEREYTITQRMTAIIASPPTVPQMAGTTHSSSSSEAEPLVAIPLLLIAADEHVTLIPLAARLEFHELTNVEEVVP